MSPNPLQVMKYDGVTVEVYANKQEMGEAAAFRAAAACAEIMRNQAHANLVFSTGASQFMFIAALRAAGIDWRRVYCFHLDEYVDISPQHPASFRLWLRQRVETPLQPAVFHYIEGDAPDAGAECRRYARLLADNPIDLGLVGVGENGHIAFNNPPADFTAADWVHVVELDMACRRQQVGEGWFASVDEVPARAVSLSVPAIMAFQRIISVIPDQRKAKAVHTALTGPISPHCPASILRIHPNATMFLDAGSASLLD